MSASIDKKTSNVQGNCVKPRLIQERSFVSSVTDLVYASPTNAATSSNLEKIEWVSFEECDITDPSMKHVVKNLNGGEVPIIIAIGYSCGYQIWAVKGNGDCEELLSVRDLPVKYVKFLPQPKIPSFNINADQFVSFRPLIAVCDVTSTGKPFCSVSFVSLRHSNENVRNFRFEDVVSNIFTSKHAIVVSFANKLVVLDSLTLKEQFWIKTCQPEMDVHSVAFSSIWLAYPDAKLNVDFQSCGGVSAGEDHQSYTNQFVSAVKNLSKTATEVGASLATSLAGSSRNSSSKSLKSAAEVATENVGVVTILNVEQFIMQNTGIHGISDGTGIIAHFPAHVDERVASMKFNASGTLLLTCAASGHHFHVFSIMPHPSSSSMGAVQHLYILQRGSTLAKVQNISFSIDSRWVSISTYNGTTHLFPITPYGGPVNVRTHASPRVVNRESRFFRSAGLDSLDAAIPIGATSQHLSSSPVGSKPTASKELHPSLSVQHMSLYRSASNPRLPPYPHATTEIALAKIKHQNFGLPNLSVDFGAVKNPIAKKSDGLTKSGSSESLRYKIATTFSSPRGWKILSPSEHPEGFPYSLYVIRSDGVFCEYQLCVRPSPSTATRISLDNSVELQVLPLVEWPLGRSRSDRDLCLPLHNEHLLLAACATQNVALSKGFNDENEQKGGNNVWISQIEILTYAGPHRRLWMGPQFTFKTYFENQKSAPLVSPNGRSRVDRSEPMAMPGRTTLHSVPVMIEANSMGSFDQASDLVVEVCGSWSDNDYISCDEQEGRLRESIADAMLDQPNSPFGGPSNMDAASASAEELSLSSTGSGSRGGMNHSPNRDIQFQFGNVD